MIDIDLLSDRDVGAWVVYRPGKGLRARVGWLLRWTDRDVFIYLVPTPGGEWQEGDCTVLVTLAQFLDFLEL